MMISGKNRDDLISTLTLARRSLRNCPAGRGIIDRGFDGTHHADICIRADGQDYHVEGDWARHALHLLRKIAYENGIRNIPDGDGGLFPLEPLPKPYA